MGEVARASGSEGAKTAGFLPPQSALLTAPPSLTGQGSLFAFYECFLNRYAFLCVCFLFRFALFLADVAVIEDPRAAERQRDAHGDGRQQIVLISHRAAGDGGAND